MTIDPTSIARMAQSQGGVVLIDSHHYTIDELNRLVVEHAISLGYDVDAPLADAVDVWDHDDAIDWLNSSTLTHAVWWGYEEHSGAFGCWLIEEDDQ